MLDPDAVPPTPEQLARARLHREAERRVGKYLQYVVERRRGSWFWKRWIVRPASATGELFSGTYWQCMRVQLALQQAAANGGYVASHPEDFAL